MVSYLNRTRFEITLTLETDMHIGTGERATLGELVSNPGENKDAEVALTARGFDCKPIIPATALKSALRRAAPEADRDAWFGAVKAGDLGNAGCIWLGSGFWASSPTDCADLPHWYDGARQTFIATHVAIARATRTAEDQKLYNVERVPKGTTFKVTGDVLASSTKADDILRQVFGLLEQGISVGADERHGSGLIKLESSKRKVTYHQFDAASASIKQNTQGLKSTLASLKTKTDQHRFKLDCAGPYVSLDTTEARGNNREPARRNSKAPMLSPASLLGAIRSRCAWLSWSVASADQGVAWGPGDDPFRAVIKRDEIDQLTSTERLFGVNGWRGLVRVTALTMTGTLADQPYTSVALDRFTQGPLDEALFTTCYFHGCRLEFTLQCDRRTLADASFPSPADKALFDALLADIKTNGLMLGHGTNKGFGWFATSKYDVVKAVAEHEPQLEKTPQPAPVPGTTSSRMPSRRGHPASSQNQKKSNKAKANKKKGKRR